MPRKILEHIYDFENIIWDWNGTLLNDKHVVHETEADLFPKYGMHSPSVETRQKLFCFPIVEYYKKVGFNFEKHNFEQLNRDFMAIYESKLKNTPLFEGMAELLAEIKNLGKKQYILSAGPQDHLNEIVPAHKIDHLFEAVYGLSSNDAHSKIERGHELVRDFGLEPSQTLLIGDTEHDFEVAEALGFESLLIADGHKPFEILVKVGKRVIPSRYTCTTSAFHE